MMMMMMMIIIIIIIIVLSTYKSCLVEGNVITVGENRTASLNTCIF